MDFADPDGDGGSSHEGRDGRRCGRSLYAPHYLPEHLRLDGGLIDGLSGSHDTGVPDVIPYRSGRLVGTVAFTAGVAGVLVRFSCGLLSLASDFGFLFRHDMRRRMGGIRLLWNIVIRLSRGAGGSQKEQNDDDEMLHVQLYGAQAYFVAGDHENFMLPQSQMRSMPRSWASSHSFNFEAASFSSNPASTTFSNTTSLRLVKRW